MATSKNLNEKAKAVLFDELISSYLQPSFGSMSKKEVDLLVFRLLFNNGMFGISPDMQAISRFLRIPISKVKTLVYEIQLRDGTRDEKWFKDSVLSSLQFARFRKGEEKIEIGIEDPLLRKELEAKIKKFGNFPDYSFNREILKFDFDTYLALLETLTTENERTVIQKTIEREFKERKNPTGPLPSWRELSREFLIAAAKKGGEKTIDLTFGILTGGASLVSDVAQAFID